MHRRSPHRLLRVHWKTCPSSDATLLDMAKELVTDQLWEIIEPLLPPEEPKPKGSRPRVPDRAALTGLERPHFLRKHWGQVRQRAEVYRTLAPTCVLVLSIKARITRYVTSPTKRCQK